MRSLQALAASLLLVALSTGTADAARRRFTWLWDTDVVPERTVEMEWWVWEVTGYGPNVSWLYAAGVVGLTDNLELAVPVELVFLPGGVAVFGSYGAELRWRLNSADAAKAGPLAALVRAGARRLVALDAARFDGAVTVSLDMGDRLRAVIDAEVFAPTNGNSVIGTGGAGLSCKLTDELFAGAELYGESAFAEGSRPAWISLGPDFSMSYGRFWLTAALLFGLNEDAPDLLPKIIWATAF